MTLIGIGRSANRNSKKAGEEASAKAASQLNGAQPGLLLAFATAGHDQAAFLEGVRAASGQAPLAGCSTSGVITSEGTLEGSFAGVVMSIASDELQFETYQAGSLSKDPAACAKDIVGQIKQRSRIHRDQGRLLLVFPDGLTGNVAELLNVLVDQLPYPLAISGGTAGELLKTDRTWQYYDGAANTNAVTAVLIGGPFVPEIAASHGCEPIGTEHVITRAEGCWVYEIEGRSAWDVYRQYLDISDTDELTMSHFCYLCLAEQLPEPDPKYGDSIIHCPLKVDTKTGAMYFPGPLAEGRRVRMALRSVERTSARATASARSIVERHPGAKPLLVFHFECCCRGSLLFGERCDEHLGKVQDVFGADVPWIGFQTYGEISALRSHNIYFHNYASVICAIYPEAGPETRPEKRPERERR